MHTLTTHDFSRQPQQLIDDARRGEATIVTQEGEPILMAVPLGKGIEAPGVRLEVAVTLYDREQVSLGSAARLAGLSISEMIDELGRRHMPVVRYSEDDLAKELDYVRSLAGR